MFPHLVSIVSFFSFQCFSNCFFLFKKYIFSQSTMSLLFLAKSHLVYNSSRSLFTYLTLGLQSILNGWHHVCIGDLVPAGVIQPLLQSVLDLDLQDGCPRFDLHFHPLERIGPIHVEVEPDDPVNDPIGRDVVLPLLVVQPIQGGVVTRLEPPPGSVLAGAARPPIIIVLVRGAELHPVVIAERIARGSVVAFDPQRKELRLGPHPEVVVDCVLVGAGPVPQVDAEGVVGVAGEVVHGVEPQPVLGVDVAEAEHVVVPAAREVDVAVAALLYHGPAAAVCIHVAPHIHHVAVRQFERVHPRQGHPTHLQLVTV